MHNVLVVGSGISGCVAARMLAENGYSVLMVERRNHVGGNTYDAKNAAGLTIQMHGTHIFHAKDARVWDFLTRFTDWRFFQLKAQTYVEGRHVPFPINQDTINQLYGFNLDAFSFGRFIDARRQRLDKPKNLRDAITMRIGEELYDLFFKNYIRKQWGLDGETLPVFLAGRQSARENRDERTFTDPFQGVPERGYSAMFNKMLAHPGIEVRLNTPYRDLPNDCKRLPTIYTGCIDEYFDYRFGKLPYRSLRFLFKTYDYEWHQPAAVVHFPNDYDFIRASECKHWTGESSRQTTVVYEYPTNDGEPYFPNPTRKARDLYEKYAAAAAEAKGLHFIGPFGRYRNLDMNHAALDAMTTVDRHFPPLEPCSVVVVE